MWSLRKSPGFSYLLTVLLLATTSFASCTQQKLAAFPPYLPPEYYNCIEVRPSELVIAYFSTYGNMAHSESEYNNRYFVFKNQIVEDWMIKELDQGWIWVEGNVKCELANVADMNAFNLGDRIDIVGLNAGVISYSSAGLLFTKCIVLTAGAVELPAAGGPAFVGGY
jgi:hypothetical protein